MEIESLKHVIFERRHLDMTTGEQSLQRSSCIRTRSYKLWQLISQAIDAHKHRFLLPRLTYLPWLGYNFRSHWFQRIRGFRNSEGRVLDPHAVSQDDALTCTISTGAPC